MTTKEVKLQIIENFIDHHTTNDAERQEMKAEAQNYVNEDWVDEIDQSGYKLPESVNLKEQDNYPNIEDVGWMTDRNHQPD